MNKKNKNHFVSVGIAQNFRVANSNMWKLNCQTGEITNRHTGTDKLFMGKRLWSREVEDAFMELENKLLPLIKQVLNAPYSNMAPDQIFQVFPLGEKYLPVFSYLWQSYMFQRANTPASKGKDEKWFTELLSWELTPPTNTMCHVRFNPIIFANTPLLLVDNCFLIYPTPPNPGEQKEYSIIYALPIAPYSCLVWGSEEQLNFFLRFFHTPDAINKNKIMQEEKKCEVASHSLAYLERIKKELPYLRHRWNQIQVSSERQYPLTEEKNDGQAENAHAE